MQGLQQHCIESTCEVVIVNYGMEAIVYMLPPLQRSSTNVFRGNLQVRTIKNSVVSHCQPPVFHTDWVGTLADNGILL